MAQPTVRIWPMAHSCSGAPGTPGLVVGLGRKSSRPPGPRRGPNNGICSFQSNGQALSTDEQNPSVGSHHGTLAHFAYFSSLSRAPHRASQHGSQRASAAASPVSIVRVHQWVDVPALSGITVWLTGSASFSAVEGPSPSSSHTARLRPTHGAQPLRRREWLYKSRPRAHDGSGSGIYHAQKPVERVNGGSASTRALVLEPFLDSLLTANPVDSGGKSLKH
jgi:hypothetical protein